MSFASECQRCGIYFESGLACDYLCPSCRVAIARRHESETGECVVCGNPTVGKSIASMLCKSCFDKWKNACLYGNTLIAGTISDMVEKYRRDNNDN